jgi:protein phosphatase
MGYQVNREEARAVPPLGRKTVFLGDYCDRGPRNLDALRLVMHMAAEGALCLPGNHEMKLLKKLRGSQVNLTYGLERTTAEFEGADPAFIEEVKGFLDGLVSHYVLDGGNLVAAHAGLKEKLQGRSSGIVRNFCLYGETTGETDEYGLPVRLDWAEEYRGKALVVYGHTPVPEALVYNNTVCIDTGCVFGGKLSAYRYPEGEIVQVPAQAQYYAPAKPLAMGGVDGNSGLALSIGDILGTRRIATRLIPEILIEERSSAVALETISRFAADPRWLIYLPPTMSPCETSGLAEYLEYPAESFEYYRKRGIFNLICEEKHMGSRAVIILCRNEETARERFGVSGGTGIIYTRTGRHFFDEEAIETALLDRLRSVLDRSRFWEDFSTPWLCLDTELLPWSAKARSLILEQYAPTGRAGRSGLTRVLAALAVREDRSKRDALSAGEARVGAVGTCAPAAPAQAGIVSGGDFDPEALGEAYHCRLECLEAYTAAYRRYCRPVNSVADYRIAPFHILATEGTVWNEETHLRHLEVIRNYMCGEDPIFIPTRYRLVDIGDEASLLEAADWWRELTGSGGEGMVVKPLDFIAWGSEREGMGEQGSRRRLAQPALKCRGREYLRIIYGPEYTAPAYMERLRKRSLSRKRHLALSEFGLGMEALERFVRREPFRRVHECVFGILALESEPVDPRL